MQRFDLSTTQIDDDTFSASVIFQVARLWCQRLFREAVSETYKSGPSYFSDSAMLVCAQFCEFLLMLRWVAMVNPAMERSELLTAITELAERNAAMLCTRLNTGNRIFCYFLISLIFCRDKSTIPCAFLIFVH